MKSLTRELSGAPTLTIDVIALLNNAGLGRGEVRAYTPIVKQSEVLNEIGQKVVDKILDNTLNSRDKDGKPFKSYQPSYTESTRFKIYKGSNKTVNLKLTGNMHADLAVVNQTSTTVTVGFTDFEEAQKAKGHITGANYLPRRDFFGLKKEELKEIMLDTIAEYQDEAELFEYVEAFDEIDQAKIDDIFEDVFEVS